MHHLVVLACVLARQPPKEIFYSFLKEKNASPEKILATPMNLPSPGKNPADAHR